MEGGNLKMYNNRELWTDREDRILSKKYADTETAKIAKSLGRTRFATAQRANILGLKKDEVEYAVYKGDELIAIGTGDEISKQLGITKNTVSSYATPKRKARALKKEGSTYAIRLDDDDEEGDW